MMLPKEDLDKDLRLAYDNYMMAVRNGNREQIENTKILFDLLMDEKNQKTTKKTKINLDFLG